MNLLTITAILYLVTGILHLSTIKRFGNTPVTRSIAFFGVIYLILSLLVFINSYSWVPVAALIITAIGAIGAATLLKNHPDLRTSNLILIAIDLVIIGFLISSM